MNLRQLEIILAGAAVPITWVILAVVVYPIPPWPFFVLVLLSALAGGFFTSWLVARSLAGGPGLSAWAKAGPVILVVVAPLVFFIWGRTVRGDDAQAAQSVTPANGPVAVKDEGEKPAPGKPHVVDPKDVRDGLDRTAKKAAGVLVTAPDGQVAVKRKEFVLTPDGSGGGTIHVSVPPANFIRTTLAVDQSWAFYIATARADNAGRSMVIPGLQVGIIKRRIADGKEIVFWAPLSGDEFARPDAYRLRYDTPKERPEAAAYHPKAELCFQTPSVVHPTQFLVLVRRSNGPIGSNEYMPGIPLAQRLH